MSHEVGIIFPLYLERVEGIEPSTQPWQGRVLTVSTIPAVLKLVEDGRVELPTPRCKRSVFPTILIPQITIVKYTTHRLATICLFGNALQYGPG